MSLFHYVDGARKMRLEYPIPYTERIDLFVLRGVRLS